jgi:hypothetical protein
MARSGGDFRTIHGCRLTCFRSNHATLIRKEVPGFGRTRRGLYRVAPGVGAWQQQNAVALGHGLPCHQPLGKEFFGTLRIPPGAPYEVGLRAVNVLERCEGGHFVGWL